MRSTRPRNQMKKKSYSFCLSVALDFIPENWGLGSSCVHYVLKLLLSRFSLSAFLFHFYSSIITPLFLFYFLFRHLIMYSKALWRGVVTVGAVVSVHFPLSMVLFPFFLHIWDRPSLSERYQDLGFAFHILLLLVITWDCSCCTI